ncbi:MAG: Holliday junction resolvase RuvX [candidate division SR1 bacterium]|nr:Holliday junction resolvase RuvX [candidate division SR1 bacterium]
MSFMQTNHRKTKSILGIDRGTRYIGLAYALPGSDVIFPVGYILNDQMMYFNVAGIIEKHNVGKIMLGRPSKQKDIQAKIQGFMKSLGYIIENREIEIQLVEEDYTSVQSGEITSNFKKNAAEDTVSAMLILERGLKDILNRQKNEGNEVFLDDGVIPTIGETVSMN